MPCSYIPRNAPEHLLHSAGLLSGGDMGAGSAPACSLWLVRCTGSKTTGIMKGMARLFAAPLGLLLERPGLACTRERNTQ